MNKIPFSKDEMTVKYVIPGRRGRMDVPTFNSPVEPRENYKMGALTRNAHYIPDYKHIKTFTPRVVPDNEARAFLFDGGAPSNHPEGFKDMFGVNWIYVEVVGGSMEEPGKAPMLDDMNDWKDVLVWPDIDSWDWTGQQEISKDYIIKNGLALTPTIMTGYFERMISLMGFENAALAMIDDEQKEAVHAFLDKLSDLYCALIDKYIEYFPIDGVSIHDDWGSQRAPFFSLETVREMLVPHIKKVTAHAHAKGLFYDMHSCGQIELLIPAMIEAGVDSWTGQEMNDKKKLYHLYGDKMMIGVETPEIPADMSIEEIDHLAKEFVDEFVNPGAIAMIGFSSQIHHPHFIEALYQYSREKLGN